MITITMHTWAIAIILYSSSSDSTNSAMVTPKIMKMQVPNYM